MAQIALFVLTMAVLFVVTGAVVYGVELLDAKEGVVDD